MTDKPSTAAETCPECGHPKKGDGHGNCGVDGCKCEYSVPVRGSIPATSREHKPNVGGYVIVLPIELWHAAAKKEIAKAAIPVETGAELEPNHHWKWFRERGQVECPQKDQQWHKDAPELCRPCEYAKKTAEAYAAQATGRLREPKSDSDWWVYPSGESEQRIDDKCLCTTADFADPEQVAIHIAGCVLGQTVTDDNLPRILNALRCALAATPGAERREGKS